MEEQSEEKGLEAEAEPTQVYGHSELLDSLIENLEDLLKEYADDEQEQKQEEEEELPNDQRQEEEEGDSESHGSSPAPAPLPTLLERNASIKRAFRDKESNQKRIFRLQLEARAQMLLSGSDDPAVRFQARELLRAYSQLDASYIPCKPKKKHRGTVVQAVNGLFCQQTELYDRERLKRASPAYMAPFHLRSLKETTAADVQSRGVSSQRRLTNLRSEVPAIPRDDPNAPHLFGNCLLSFPCQCQACASAADADADGDDGNHQHPTPCLLHPVGALQDRVRLSFLSLPRGRRIFGQKEPRFSVPEELNMGDRIRQLEQCGSDPYRVVVRTSQCVIVLSVKFVKPRREEPLLDGECWGNADLKLLHRIDHRTMWRSQASFRPIDVACQPRYGVGGFAPSKIAVAYESSVGDRNIIHHIQAGEESLTSQKFSITNLREIYEIDFASHNPMILWAAALSYVRPALTSSYTHKRPRIGHGSSLYSIDLRSKSNTAATFQWSPSAEDFLPEGIHSISSLLTDWKKPHCVWVSSTSAGKTWELDMRMPCRAVNTWSLPHTGDQVGATLPTTGLYGAGTLFVPPPPSSSSSFSNAVQSGIGGDHFSLSCPSLSVGKSPGTYGMHLYQRPRFEPRFQTRSIECTASPALSGLGAVSVATSSTFALPDVSDRVFTCGLAAFRRPFSTYLEATDHYEETELRSVLCAVSLTSKGDIYAHSMLESQASRRQSRNFDGLPVGCSILPIPGGKDTSFDSTGSWNTLRISLSNDFPVPSQSVVPSFDRPTHGDAIDLSPIVEREEAALKKQIRKEQMQTLREKTVAENESEAGAEADGIPSDEEDEAGKSASGEERTEAVPAVAPAFAHISGNTQRAFVVSSLIGESTNLRLPSHLLPQSIENEVEHFHPERKSSIEGNDAAFGRSDLTRDILDNDWEYSSDDSAF